MRAKKPKVIGHFQNKISTCTCAFCLSLLLRLKLITSESSNKTKYVVVKASINAIEWNPIYLEHLEKLIIAVNELIKHSYQLARFIFLHELSQNTHFDLAACITKAFFVEVFLALIKNRETYPERLSDETSQYRSIIEPYLSMYQKVTNFYGIPLANAQQIALYQGNAICTVYLNGVENHLGNYIRHVVNVLLDIKKRSKQLRRTMKDQGFNTQAINQAVKEQITAPATEFKQRLASKTVDLANLSTECATVYQILAPVLECYPRDYTFTKNNRWLDIKINPKHHIKAFHRLVTLAEEHGFKLFQCFPMKHGWIPGEIIIDTTILKQHFLQEMLISKEEAWERVVNTDKKPFKPQQGCHFRGTIYTDGVAVTIVKTDGETRAGGPRRAYKRKIGKEDQYVEKLNDQELKQLDHRSVLIDPGRRDLLYAMHEDSQPNYPIKYQYTRNQKRRTPRPRYTIKSGSASRRPLYGWLKHPWAKFPARQLTQPGI